MAQALSASAEANRYLRTRNVAALEKTMKSADWLADNKDINKNGIIGWGLPTPFDAFNDGSENPADTEYTITTALAIQGFLDVVDAIDSDTFTRIIYRENKQKYLKTSVEAVGSFIDNKFYEEKDGDIVFWYSSQRQDQYPVMNVNAMFSGVLQRISSYPISKDRQVLCGNLADKGMRYLLSIKKEKNGGWYWDYFDDPLPPNVAIVPENDLIHAAYVVDGLLMYRKYNGHLSAQIDEQKILDGLKIFVENGRILRMFSQPELSSLSWNVGYFLYVVSSYYSNESGLENIIYQNILNRQTRDGFSYTEAESSHADYVRYNAHVLLGLSKFFWR